MKRSTWVLLLVLAIAIGAYYLFNSKTDPAETEPLDLPTSTPESFLLDATDDALASIRLFDRQYNIVELLRDENGYWMVSLPTQGAADFGTVGAAESQITALRILTIFDSPPDLGAAGLLFPEYTLKLGYASGVTHIVEIGSQTPTGSGYYVRLDRGDVSIVSVSGIDALTNLLVSPPYLPSSTPTAEPTATPTAPEGTIVSAP
jgi:hypothetical protein